jgi:hypothetical protein
LARRAQWPHGALQLFVSGKALFVEIELPELTPVGSVEPFPVGGIDGYEDKDRNEKQNFHARADRSGAPARNVMPFPAALTDASGGPKEA